MINCRFFICSFFSFKLLPKFRDFINSDTSIEKKYTKIYHTISSFYSINDFNLTKKKGLFIMKKIRNSGNYIYDYAHTFFLIKAVTLTCVMFVVPISASFCSVLP